MPKSIATDASGIRHADFGEEAVPTVHEDETHGRGAADKRASLRGGKPGQKAGQRKSAESKECMFEEVSAVIHKLHVRYFR